MGMGNLVGQMGKSGDWEGDVNLHDYLCSYSKTTRLVHCQWCFQSSSFI
jgi:hypothetical protein